MSVKAEAHRELPRGQTASLYCWCLDQRPRGQKVVSIQSDGLGHLRGNIDRCNAAAVFPCRRIIIETSRAALKGRRYAVP